MLARAVFSILIVLVPATSFADSAESGDGDLTISYRDQTLVADGIGLALLVAGGITEGDGGQDTGTSDALFAAGGLTMLFGAPLVHGFRGHAERGVGSLLMRGGLAGAGLLISIAANSGCDDGMPPPDGALLDDDFLCELDYAGYGMLAGLVAATVLDAAFLTDEHVETGRAWAPQIAATRDGGVRVGAAFAW